MLKSPVAYFYSGTLAQFCSGVDIPVLVWMYVHLARQEEREALKDFGDAYREYMARVPGFVPRRLMRGGHTSDV